MENCLERNVKGDKIKFDKELRAYIVERPKGVLVECLTSTSRSSKNKNLTLLEALIHCIKGVSRLKENITHSYNLSVNYHTIGHVHIKKERIRIDFDELGFPLIEFVYDKARGLYVATSDTYEQLTETPDSFNSYVVLTLLRTMKLLALPENDSASLSKEKSTVSKGQVSLSEVKPTSLQRDYEQKIQEFYHLTGLVFDRNNTSYKQSFTVLEFIFPLLKSMCEYMGLTNLKGLKGIRLVPLSTYQNVSFKGRLVGDSKTGYIIELVSKPFGKADSENYAKRCLSMQTTFAHEFGHYIELRYLAEGKALSIEEYKERNVFFSNAIIHNFEDKGIQNLFTDLNIELHNEADYLKLMRIQSRDKKIENIQYYASIRELFACMYSQVIMENCNLPTAYAMKTPSCTLESTQRMREMLQTIKEVI